MDNVEKKYVKFDEVVKLVQEALKEPEHSGKITDYMELCKLYDKNDNGTLMLVFSASALRMCSFSIFSLTFSSSVDMAL